MINAKVEFNEHVAGKAVLCAAITYGDSWISEPERAMNLPVNYSQADLAAFLAALDFSYDEGYGGQNLFGTIWYADGTWSARGEYDGSEWWEHNVCPPIPNELQDYKGADNE